MKKLMVLLVAFLIHAPLARSNEPTNCHFEYWHIDNDYQYTPYVYKFCTCSGAPDSQHEASFQLPSGNWTYYPADCGAYWGGGYGIPYY